MPNPPTVIVVNRHLVLANRKHGYNDPPIRVSLGKHGRPCYGRKVVVTGPSTIIYDTGNPLPCGATVWIETYGNIIITEPPGGQSGKRRRRD